MDEQETKKNILVPRFYVGNYCQQRCYKFLVGDSEGPKVVERANTNRSSIKDFQFQQNVVKIVSITGRVKQDQRNKPEGDTNYLEMHQSPPGSSRILDQKSPEGNIEAKLSYPCFGLSSLFIMASTLPFGHNLKVTTYKSQYLIKS